MSTRWSADAVLALAADEPSRRAVRGLARPASWNGAGATPDLVWGLCAGSGRNPYQVIVELSGPAYKCSCPSRKFPCKHALALLMTWADGEVPDQAGPSDYAAAWAGGRRARAARAAARAGSQEAPDVGACGPGPSEADAEASARKRHLAATARRAQRAERVAAGLSELAEWLRDQVRVGLAASVQGTAGGKGNAGHADVMAARMADAQAPGVAGVLRELSLVPSSGADWPGRLLAGYAQLHLLARAHERLAELPPGLAATVRSRIGYTTGSQEVLARPAVADQWMVTGVRDIPDATVPTRRIWLHGRSSRRSALLLAFAVNGTWTDQDTAMLPLGTEIDADLHYYPGNPPQRALIGSRRGAPARRGRAPEPGDLQDLLARWADGIAADPWLTAWPALLSGTPVAPAGTPFSKGGDPPSTPPYSKGGDPPSAPSGSGQWHLVDAGGTAAPLRYSESLWTLLAVSGGNPVTVAGEWTPDGLTALTVWHGGEAVPL